MEFKLDYGQCVILDADELAKSGFMDTYDMLRPTLQKHISQPAEIQEVFGDGNANYSIRYGTREFVIYSPELDDKFGGWGRATFAFFAIINDQLSSSEYRFYAIDNGNGLGGIFLTLAQAMGARGALPKKTDWPYIPTNDAPWYGQQHD